jgi:anthranilate phosphoribosyltransferase
MKSYAEYLSLLIDDSEAQLSPHDLECLAGALLDGGVPDIELGAMLAMLRARSDCSAWLQGMLTALSARSGRWSGSDRVRAVAIGCYGGTNDCPDLTPLLALLLARFGIPVLMHGPLHAGSGVSVTLVLRELGIMPCANSLDVARELHGRGLAFVPDALLSPGLATLLSHQARLGPMPLLRSAARLLDPFESGALVVAAADDAAEIGRMQAAIAACGMRVLLLRATEGQPFASPHLRPRMEYWQFGSRTVLFEEDTAQPRRTLVLPAAADVKATASWIKQACDGARAVPHPLVNQLAACLYGAAYCDDFNQAKALAAIAAAGRRVA